MTSHDFGIVLPLSVMHYTDEARVAHCVENGWGHMAVDKQIALEYPDYVQRLVDATRKADRCGEFGDVDMGAGYLQVWICTNADAHDGDHYVAIAREIEFGKGLDTPGLVP